MRCQKSVQINFELRVENRMRLCIKECEIQFDFRAI